MPTRGLSSPDGPRRDGLVGLTRALDTVGRLARGQADDVLAHVPDTGDVDTGRAVDDFVEQAADALRALDEAMAETLRRLDAGRADPADPADAVDSLDAVDAVDPARPELRR